MRSKLGRGAALGVLLVLAGLVLPWMATPAHAAPTGTPATAKGVTLVHFYADW